jgi:uncharacterized protein
MKRNYLHLIEEFLALRRIAIVGASRNQRSFSRALMTELIERGYDVVPVNPHTHDLGGIQCVRTVSELDPLPEGALVILPPDKAAEAVADCADAGIRHVWLHRGSESPEALKRAQEAGIAAIPGECMFMYLPDTSLIHRIHRAINRMTGRYPT